jgi:type IV pilus assembly protein PilA
MKLQNKLKKGFTLIELMIVVAIIGVLASVAIPAYQDYIKSANLGAKISEVNAYKTAIGMCAQRAGGLLATCDAPALAAASTGGLPLSATATVLTDSGGVASVTDGVIILTTLVPDIPTVTLTPTLPAGSASMVWRVDCTSTTLDLAGVKNLLGACTNQI